MEEKIQVQGQLLNTDNMSQEEKEKLAKEAAELRREIEPEASVKAPPDFTAPEDLYRELIASIRKYHPSDDITMVEKAYYFACKAHEGQFRKSGEPYIIHPICVAIILAELELDKESIIAGLLHDVLEDTDTTLSLIHI